MWRVLENLLKALGWQNTTRILKCNRFCLNSYPFLSPPLASASASGVCASLAWSNSFIHSPFHVTFWPLIQVVTSGCVLLCCVSWSLGSFYFSTSRVGHWGRSEASFTALVYSNYIDEFSINRLTAKLQVASSWTQPEALQCQCFLLLAMSFAFIGHWQGCPGPIACVCNVSTIPPTLR